MKPSTQTSKAGGSLNPKSKKSSKDREKRKSQGGTSDVTNHNSTEKGSPTKDSNTRLYAGIDADSLTIYAEQTAMEHLSEEINNTLTEDINYRLRYIINDSLIKARLSGRNAISSTDLEHTFQNLRVDRIYGAPSHPNWVPFGYQNLYYLDDKLVNVVEIAEGQHVYNQHTAAVITTKWISELKDISKPLKNYFTTMCQMIVSSDAEVRKMALRNIGENPRIGTIIEWFYNFGYILLSKDITYDCLTLRALDLIRTLENSRSCRINVSEKQLKLLVRLILQRLLKSATASEVLKPICEVLTILCQRQPLKDFVIAKIAQKVTEVFDSCPLAIVTAANSLGIDAVACVILPNLDLFLTRILDKQELPFIQSLLESYYILSKENLVEAPIYGSFFEIFADGMCIFNQPHAEVAAVRRKDLNFANVRYELIKTRRKICPKLKLSLTSPIEEIFEMPPENSKLKKILDDHRWDGSAYTSDTDVIIGRTTLLLPVFKQKKVKTYPKCHDHTLLAYNL